MIIQKEFYFVRHGQTDGNIGAVKQDHGDIPLNATGREQAQIIRPIIDTLSVKTICYSPLKRAKETGELACASLAVPQVEVTNLGECNMAIWQEMTVLGKRARTTLQEPVYGFMRRVLQGINEALSFDGPVLMVSHGGVHWAVCCLMGIDEHDFLLFKYKF